MALRPDELAELRLLVEAASGCAGPCGLSRAIRSSDAPGARTFITSSSAAALKHWPVARSHHVLRLVVDTAQAHVARHRDCGWLFLNFCLRVALALTGLGRAGTDADAPSFARPAALRGLALAATWLDETLGDSRCPCRHVLDWSDLTSAMALLRSALCKPVALAATEDVRHLSVTILEAFLNVLPSCAEAGSPSAEANIRYAWFCGLDVSWSTALHGLLLDTPAAIATGPASRAREDSRLALFTASLEQWLPGATGDDSQPVGLESYTVESRYPASPGDADMLRQWELSQFGRLAEGLLAAGVGVLACQKLVDPWLVDHLRHSGVTVLSRLSLRHVDHVQRLTGAMPVASLAALPARWTDVCGDVGPIETRIIQERTYAVLHPPTRRTATGNRAAGSSPTRVSTLLIGAPDEHSLAELKQCVPQAVHALQEAAHTGATLHGGGLAEVHLADALSARAGQLLQETGDAAAAGAVRTISECLLDVAACLPAGSGGPGGKLSGRGEFLEAARTALGHLAAGGGRPPGGVLEAAGPKRQALLGALDLAGILVRLGGTLDFVNNTLG